MFAPDVPTCTALVIPGTVKGAPEAAVTPSPRLYFMKPQHCTVPSLMTAQLARVLPTPDPARAIAPVTLEACGLSYVCDVIDPSARLPS